MVLASLSTAALFLSLASPQLALPNGASLIAGFLNVPHLVFVWLFALSVFQTKFRLSKWHVAVSLIYVAALSWFRAYQLGFVPQPPLFLNIAISLGSISLMGHLVWTILRERKDDLVEARKRSRATFVAVLVAVTVLTALVDIYLIIAWPDYALLIKAATMWPAVLAAFFWIIKASDERFILHSEPATFGAAKAQVSAKDAPIFDRLQKSINEDHVYLNPDLTISDLAKELGVTSQRLRALINQSMGYENFNQFLNSLRIQSILRKFDDPSLDHVPILTIALENGFQSLSPFNRSFKDIVDKTPSQYRKSRC